VELKDFIKGSLVEIAEGIREPNEAYKASMGEENIFHLWPSLGKDAGEKGIHFDVAVTTEKEGGAKGGISVLGIDAGVKRQTANESVSRIQFTVAVKLFIG